MTLMQLRAFECLAKSLNYAKTAEVLFISQPAVTQLIKTLEDEIGTPLFKRSTRKVELTEAGTVFIEDTRDVLSRLDNAVIKVRNYSGAFSSSLRISLTNGPVMNNIDRIIRNYRRIDQKVHLHIDYNDAISAFLHFIDGKADVCFGVLDEEHPLYKTIQFEELLQSRYACYVSVDSPLAECSELCFEDLEGCLFIFAENDVCPPEIKKMQDRILKLYPAAIGYYSNSPEITMSMIRAGLGVAVLPDFLFSAPDGIRKIPISDEDILRYGIYTRESDNSTQLKYFIRIVKQSVS